MRVTEREETEKVGEKIIEEDFPSGPTVKSLPVNARDTGSIPSPGRSHMLRSNEATEDKY